MRLRVPAKFAEILERNEEGASPEFWISEFKDAAKKLSQRIGQCKTKDGCDYISHIFGSQAMGINESKPHIQWAYNVREAKQDQHLENGIPFSILSIFDSKSDSDNVKMKVKGKKKEKEVKEVKQNIIYGHDGKCAFQVDFDEHSSGDVHLHVLIPGNFDRAQGEKNHSLPWECCPWVWLAIPAADDDGHNLQVRLSPGNQEYVEIDYPENEDHQNPKFKECQGLYNTTNGLSRTSDSPVGSEDEYSR